MRFDGRSAIVTGGASGIGAATAAMLREAGAKVVTWDRDPNADVACDVSSLASVRQALDLTLTAIGTPSILVHCAAITARSSIVDLDLDSWDRTLEVNTRGAFMCLGVVAQAMIDGDVDQGSIVLTSSTASILPDPGTAAYGVSKAGVDHLAKVAAVELGPYRIRVNSVSPGPTETPLTKRTFSSDSYRQRIIDTTPLRKLGTPQLLADAILGTLGMEWVTGQSIVADGGTHLVTPRGAQRAQIGGNFKAGQRSGSPSGDANGG